MTETAILNVTYNGLSSDQEQPIHTATPDEDVRRIAAECLGLAPGTFDHFVVDRFNTEQGGHRVYLRPKVPFGAGA